MCHGTWIPRTEFPQTRDIRDERIAVVARCHNHGIKRLCVHMACFQVERFKELLGLVVVRGLLVY